MSGKKSVITLLTVAVIGVAATAEAHHVRFLGPHPIAAKYGGGYCYIEAPHLHLYGPDHPYGRHSKGSVESVERLTRDGLRELHHERFAPSELTGVEGKIADAFNDILLVSERRAVETARVCRVVGKEGKLKERMRVPGAVAGWADEIEAVAVADQHGR